MKTLHTNNILWNKLNERTFKALFNKFNNLYTICKSMEEKNTSLYLMIYNLLIYALFDLIYYCGAEYIISEYGEDFSDNERFSFIPQYQVIFDHICGQYLTFEEWAVFCKNFIPRSYIYAYNIKDFSQVDLQVCIDAFFEISLPTKE